MLFGNYFCAESEALVAEVHDFSSNSNNPHNVLSYLPGNMKVITKGGDTR